MYLILEEALKVMIGHIEEDLEHRQAPAIDGVPKATAPSYSIEHHLDVLDELRRRMTINRHKIDECMVEVRQIGQVEAQKELRALHLI